MIRRPMVYAATAFALPIIVCFYADVNTSAALGCVLIVLLMCSKTRKNSIIIIVVFYFCSLLNYQIQAPEDSELMSFAGSNHVIAGKIVSVERRENQNSEGYIQMKVDVYEKDAVPLNKKERILLKYYGNSNDDILLKDYSAAAPTDYISADVDIEVPQSRRNPGGFDFALYLNSIRISVVAQTNHIEVVEKDRTKLACFTRELYLVKESYLEKLSNRAGESTSSLMRAILFGEKYELDEETVEDFRESGIAHILAVSGLHIGIIYRFISSIWIWKKNWLYFTAIMIFFMGYMFLASFSPSVVRAVIMIALHVFAQLTNRRYDITSAALIVLTIMLAFNPMALFNAGLQLSYLAVISIALILPIIRRGYNGVLLCSLAVQLGITPYMLYSFNCFSPAAVLINYPVAIIAGILVPAGVCAMFLSEVSDLMFYALAGVINRTAELLTKISSFAAIEDFTVFYVCSPGIWIICTCYLGFFAFLSEGGRMLFLRKKHMSIVVLAIGILLVSVMFDKAASDPVKNSELIFLDVGQGDAVHLRVRYGAFGKDGLLGTGLFVNEKNYLFDGGGRDSYDVGKKVIKPYLLKNGVRKLDGVFVTHLHTDHYKGVVELCREEMVDKLYLYEANKCKKQEIMDETKLDEESLVFLYKGNRVQLGRSEADILWPERKTDREYSEMINDEKNENDMSMIIKITHSNMSALITGDIDETLMDKLAKQQNIGISMKCDILKVPHHGSKYSWSEEFIRQVSPSYAVIQVGKNNYGHPAPEIVENYLHRGIKVLRNDQQGAVGFFEDSNNGIKVERMNDIKY